jgi:hypothetical protein
MRKTVISLTTIPTRLNTLIKTLSSLLRQTTRADEIILWIPYDYTQRGFECPFTIPNLPNGVTVMRCNRDYGPATKVLPTVELYKTEDVIIVYCDDDRSYHEQWLETLLNYSDKFPHDCIATSGYNIKKVEYKYQYKHRGNIFEIINVISLGYYRKTYRQALRDCTPTMGYIDICQGFGGVLVKPSFFSASAFEIPEEFWQVDDIWLSGQLKLNGVSIRKVAEGPMTDVTAAAEISPLVKQSFNGIDRVNADLACVNYFKKNYGIWADKKVQSLSGEPP